MKKLSLVISLDDPFGTGIRSMYFRWTNDRRQLWLLGDLVALYVYVKGKY